MVFLTTGGLSFLSTQYGWASNNLVAADMVLADGTILTASNTSNVDLYNSIKGGGNSFGIVTSYVLQAHPVGTDGKVSNPSTILDTQQSSWLLSR